MGVDAGDSDGSGRPALWVTNYENELHALYRNMRRARPHALHVPFAGGRHRRPRPEYVGWGTAFLDVDLDGWEDLFVANGHAIRYRRAEPPRPQRPVLLRGHGGRFTDISDRGGPYFRDRHDARGLALVDLDNDGRVDLVASHLNAPVTILRNVSPTGGNHWFGVQLTGRDHADVVGARIVVEAGGRRQTRFAKGGGSYLSSPDRRLLFGLGPVERVDKVTVFWPGGGKQEW